VTELGINDYRVQTVATVKSVLTNTCYRIGNDYRVQTVTGKSIIANTRYRIGNDYRSQVFAIGKAPLPIFVTPCIITATFITYLIAIAPKYVEKNATTQHRHR
jgi:hypothetical protein